MSLEKDTPFNPEIATPTAMHEEQWGLIKSFLDEKGERPQDFGRGSFVYDIETAVEMPTGPLPPQGLIAAVGSRAIRLSMGARTLEKPFVTDQAIHRLAPDKVDLLLELRRTATLAVLREPEDKIWISKLLRERGFGPKAANPMHRIATRQVWEWWNTLTFKGKRVIVPERSDQPRRREERSARVNLAFTIDKVYEVEGELPPRRTAGR